MNPAIGTRVRVHYNLIAAATGAPAWIVTRGKDYLGAVDEIALADCKPHYWKGRDGSDGRKQTGQYLSTHGGKRTVHAWIDGVVCAIPCQCGGRVEITYNPKHVNPALRTMFHERATGRAFGEGAAMGAVHFTAAGAAFAFSRI